MPKESTLTSTANTTNLSHAIKKKKVSHMSILGVLLKIICRSPSSKSILI